MLSGWRIASQTIDTPHRIGGWCIPQDLIIQISERLKLLGDLKCYSMGSAGFSSASIASLAASICSVDIWRSRPWGFGSPDLGNVNRHNVDLHRHRSRLCATTGELHLGQGGRGVRALRPAPSRLPPWPLLGLSMAQRLKPKIKAVWISIIILGHIDKHT
jgi:hypothetical protein